MGIPGGDPKEYDYRKLPRKRDGERRDKHYLIRLTGDELAALHEAAATKGVPLSDYIVRRCLGVSARPKPRSRRSDT